MPPGFPIHVGRVEEIIQRGAGDLSERGFEPAQLHGSPATKYQLRKLGPEPAPPVGEDAGARSLFDAETDEHGEDQVVGEAADAVFLHIVAAAAAGH